MRTLVALALVAAAADAGPKTIDEMTKAVLVSESEVDFDDPASLARFKMAKEAAYELPKLLGKHPDKWPTVRRTLLRNLPRKGKRDVQARVLRILAHDPHKDSRTTVAEALVKDPVLFADKTLVMMAEREIAGAETVLRGRVESGTTGVDVTPALYFALRGDACGKAALTKTVADQKVRTHMVETHLAALTGLRALGDDRLWRDAVAGKRQEILMRLAKGEKSHAEWLFVRVEYFDKIARAAAAKKPHPVANLTGTLFAYENARRSSLSDAEIQDTLAKLTS